MQQDPLGHDWHLAVSDCLQSELQRLGASNLPDLHVFASSPARDLGSRRKLSRLERSLQPDGVFTFAGPAYVRFSAPHLLGCTNPWVTHPTWQAYRTTAFPHQWMYKVLQAVYSRYWIGRADAWVVQTETARRGLCRRLRIPWEKTAVIPNTCGTVYLAQPPDTRDATASGKWRMLCFAAPYPHKRLDLIPFVAQALGSLEPNLAFEFVLTLPAQCAIYRHVMRSARTLGVADRIVNAGPVAVADGPELYKSCNTCLMPTVLETFSATYPEAMAMGVPLVTTDLGFAREVCGDAALYFEPNDVQSAAAQLQLLIRDPARRRHLIAEGKRVLSRLPSPSAQYARYTDLLTTLIEDRQ